MNMKQITTETEDKYKMLRITFIVVLHLTVNMKPFMMSITHTSMSL
jgi:hypothetical protein